MRDLDGDMRFANILDECCERVRRGERLESCVATYPAEYREELTHLVPMAARVGRLSRDPSPEFQARLEGRLLAHIDAARGERSAGLASRVGRFLMGSAISRGVAVAAAVLLLLGGGLGAVQVSADSLPDSPLYQVKAAREQVQLALARAPEAQVDAHVAQIDQRAKELDQAIRGGKQPKVVDAVVTRVENSVENMVDQALAARAKGNPTPARRAVVALRAAQRRLDAIIPQAQPNVRPALQQLQTFFGQEERRLLPAAGSA